MLVEGFIPPNEGLSFGSKVYLSIIQTVLWMDLRKDFGREEHPQSWDFCRCCCPGPEVQARTILNE